LKYGITEPYTMPRDLDGEREARQAHSELRSALRFAFLGMPELWEIANTLWIERLSVKKAAERLGLTRQAVGRRRDKARCRILALKQDPYGLRVLSSLFPGVELM